jgi:Shedu protein SduA, C-terminal
VIIEQKAYVGGKLYDNSSGYIVDYMAKAESTNAIVLIEIKKPQTKLLGREYRSEVYGFSEELSASVSQLLKYRQSLIRDFLTLTRRADLTDAEPSCLLVAGSTSELDTAAKRDCFHLQRHRVQGLTVITYDELFSRVQKLVTLLETGR